MPSLKAFHNIIGISQSLVIDIKITKTKEWLYNISKMNLNIIHDHVTK